MAELTDNNQKKIIAFYLPQYHAIPENDKWWGKGFTEWTNTRKALPIFEGHYQPKIPLNESYYDLSDITVMEKQSILAQKYDVYGFCYYHYWFKNGKKLLEKPIEQMLDDPKVNIPFMLCWANENWTRNWDGGNSEVIAKQEYGKEKDWKIHLEYLLQFFRDDRYIKYQGKPLLAIYKPEQIILFNEMISYWRKAMKKAGFPDIIILRQHPGKIMKQQDYSIKFQPPAAWAQWNTDGYYKTDSVKTRIKSIVKKTMVRLGREELMQQLIVKRFAESRQKKTPIRLYDYDECWRSILDDEVFNDKMCSGGFTAWDNTPRSRHGIIVHGSTPQKFETYMAELLRKPSAMNLVFVNAWNEWGEGAYLEPDEKYGYAYLEALKNALNSMYSEL